MTDKPKSFGLTAYDKMRLLTRLSGRPPGAATQGQSQSANSNHSAEGISDLGHNRQFEIVRSAGEILGIANPFFRVHEGIAGAETVIGERRCINFSSYNYLGLNGHSRVINAAKEAIDRYGTSASASRLVAGERSIHQDLERRLAEIHGAEDSIAFVSGHATNVTVIGHIMGAKDLILHDALIHNSVLQGAQLSGAHRLSFPHNDVVAAERLLASQRSRFGRTLIVIEGHYSMDGDVPDLRAFSELARRHRAWLLVDEAHSLGVLGAKGHGIAEHFGTDPGSVDIWMGTLSKSFAACGGYIAGRRDLVEYLKYSAPGFVYSVGISPPMAAAAIAAIDILQEEPERVARLNANARLFLDKARKAGLNTGQSIGAAIVPVITGSSIMAAALSDALFRRSINVQPILYPAVPERSARLRFFLSSEHTENHINTTVAALAEETARFRAQHTDLVALALKIGARLTTAALLFSADWSEILWRS